MKEIKLKQSGLIYHEKGISVFVKKRDTLIFFLQQNQKNWVPRADTRGKLRFNPNCSAGADKAPRQSFSEQSRLLAATTLANYSENMHRLPAPQESSSHSGSFLGL